MTFPTEWKNQSHVPNHQSVNIVSQYPHYSKKSIPFYSPHVLTIENHHEIQMIPSSPFFPNHVLGNRRSYRDAKPGSRQICSGKCGLGGDQGDQLKLKAMDL